MILHTGSVTANGGKGGDANTAGKGGSNTNGAGGNGGNGAAGGAGGAAYAGGLVANNFGVIQGTFLLRRCLNVTYLLQAARAAQE